MTQHVMSLMVSFCHALVSKTGTHQEMK